MSPWLFNVCMNAETKKVKTGMGRREVRECRLPDLLYIYNLVLCTKLKEDLRTMVGHFVEVCRRRALKVNKGKSKVMVLNGEKRLE